MGTVANARFETTPGDEEPLREFEEGRKLTRKAAR